MYWVRTYLGVMFHPIEAFRRIKYYRDKLNALPILIVCLLVIIVRLAYIYIAHFPVVTLNPENTNILLEMVKYIFPILSWGLVTFAVTSIWDGESFIRECMAATTAAMMPYILFSIPVALFSRMMEQNQQGILNFFNTATAVWVVVLIFLGIMTMNDFSFKHAVKVFLTSVFGMLFFWAVFLLLAALVYQLYGFMTGVLLEIRLKFGI